MGAELSSRCKVSAEISESPEVLTLDLDLASPAFLAASCPAWRIAIVMGESTEEDGGGLDGVEIEGGGFDGVLEVDGVGVERGAGDVPT